LGREPVVERRATAPKGAKREAKTVTLEEAGLAHH